MRAGRAREGGRDVVRVGGCGWAVLLVGVSSCTPLEGRAGRDSGDVADVVDAHDEGRDTGGAVSGDAEPCRTPGTFRVERAAQYASSEDGQPFRWGAARGALVDRGGKVVVFGNCARCNPADPSPHARLAAWRFQWGTLAHDRSFGAPSGAAVDEPEGESVATEAVGGAEDASGRLLLAGSESDLSGRASALVVRLLENGARDPTFGEGGRALLPRSVFSWGQSVRAYAVASEARGAVVLVADGGSGERPAEAGWAVRLTDSGALDPTFGTGGVVSLPGVLGCYDLEPDGAGYVLACISPSARPSLLRLDGAGRVLPWPGDVRAEASWAPARFEVRVLERDSAGRWIVAGAVSSWYSDLSSPAAAVRFLPDGSPDRSYGRDGVGLVLGPRTSFWYAYSSTMTVGCEDRLLVAGNFFQHPSVTALGADGLPLEDLGDHGTLVLTPSGIQSAVPAVLRAPGTSDVVVVSTHMPQVIALHRVAQ